MADFNGDGRMDIINPFDLQVYVSLGQADGTFQQVTTLLRLNFNNGHFNVGDVNKDGKPDLILNYYDHLEVWFGNGDGTFSYANSVDVQGIGSTGVALIADLDGDGNADIVMAPDAVDGGDSSLAILYGNGDGTFQSPVFIPIAHNYSQVTAVDLNRDNLPDLVMTDGASVAVMMNLGGRKFDGEVDYIAGPSVSALSVVDVNSDGYPDIVVANTGGTTVTVLLNEPNGTPPEGPSVSGILSVTPEPSLEGQPFTVTLSVSGKLYLHRFPHPHSAYHHCNLQRRQQLRLQKLCSCAFRAAPHLRHPNHTFCFFFSVAGQPDRPTLGQGHQLRLHTLRCDYFPGRQ
jgi:hypothetical protein